MSSSSRLVGLEHSRPSILTDSVRPRPDQGDRGLSGPDQPDVLAKAEQSLLNRQRPSSLQPDRVDPGSLAADHRAGLRPGKNPEPEERSQQEMATGVDEKTRLFHKLPYIRPSERNKMRIAKIMASLKDQHSGDSSASGQSLASASIAWSSVVQYVSLPE